MAAQYEGRDLTPELREATNLLEKAKALLQQASVLDGEYDYRIARFPSTAVQMADKPLAMICDVDPDDLQSARLRAGHRSDPLTGAGR